MLIKHTAVSAHQKPISSLFHSSVHFTSTYLSYLGLIKLAMPPHTPPLLTKLGILAFFIFPLSRHNFFLFENENPGCSKNSGARCCGESLLAQRGRTQLTFSLTQRPRGKTLLLHTASNILPLKDPPSCCFHSFSVGWFLTSPLDLGLTLFCSWTFIWLLVCD